MARNIDLSDVKSPEDIEYVRQRPWLIDEIRLMGYDVASELTDPDWTYEAALAGEPEEVEEGDEEPETPEDEDEDEDLEDEEEGDEYDDMSYAELQSLAKERGLPAGGSTEDLVARLREDDES